MVFPLGLSKFCESLKLWIVAQISQVLRGTHAHEVSFFRNGHLCMGHPVRFWDPTLCSELKTLLVLRLSTISLQPLCTMYSEEDLFTTRSWEQNWRYRSQHCLCYIFSFLIFFCLIIKSPQGHNLNLCHLPMETKEMRGRGRTEHRLCLRYFAPAVFHWINCRGNILCEEKRELFVALLHWVVAYYQFWFILAVLMGFFIEWLPIINFGLTLQCCWFFSPDT